MKATFLTAAFVLIVELTTAQPRSMLEPIPLPSKELSKLGRRFGKVFQPLQDFHSQWKNPKTREFIISKSGDFQPEVAIGPNRSGFVLTNKQKVWFNSLANDKAAAGQRVKRGFRFRREYRQLPCWEREEFHKALRSMKTNMIDGLSEYDIFVGFHQPVQSPAAHGGAAFLPWHREYLWRFENALRLHNPRVALPYWDSTLDAHLSVPQDSILWSDQFLGDGSGTVESGPFVNWTTIAACQPIGSLLRRNVGGVSAQALFSESDIQWVLNKTNFKDLHVPATEFEWAHGGPHVFVGGHMGRVTCSPTDPIFWMHHAFVDKVWEDFRYGSQTTDREEEYPRHSSEVNIGGQSHNPDAPMYPFDPLTNKDGLNDRYTSRFYRYMPRPETCTKHRDCGLYLFCHEGQCKPKVKVNGDCTGLVPSSFSFLDRSAPCECGQCRPVSPGSSQLRCQPRWSWECRLATCRDLY